MFQHRWWLESGARNNSCIFHAAEGRWPVVERLPAWGEGKETPSPSWGASHLSEGNDWDPDLICPPILPSFWNSCISSQSCFILILQLCLNVTLLVRPT